MPVSARRCSDLQLLDRLRDLRAGILDELRLVENHRAERKFLQLLQIAPQQRVIGDDDIVLRNLFAQIVPRRAAFQHEHFQMRRETSPPRAASCAARTPGQMTSDGLGFFVLRSLQPRQPRQRLQRFAEAHVVGENAAELDLREMAEKIETVLLIRPQFRLQRFAASPSDGTPLKFCNAFAQRLRLAANRQIASDLPRPDARPVPGRCVAARR